MVHDVVLLSSTWLASWRPVQCGFGIQVLSMLFTFVLAARGLCGRLGYTREWLRGFVYFGGFVQ